MFFISGFSLFMFIIVYVTLYLIYLMKNAIEAEKAKSAKIENDLKLEIEKLKAELEVEKETVADFKTTLYFRNVTIRSFKCELEHKDKVIEHRLYAIKAENAKIETDAVKYFKLAFVAEKVQKNVFKKMVKNFKLALVSEKLKLQKLGMT